MDLSPFKKEFSFSKVKRKMELRQWLNDGERKHDRPGQTPQIQEGLCIKKRNIMECLKGLCLKSKFLLLTITLSLHPYVSFHCNGLNGFMFWTVQKGCLLKKKNRNKSGPGDEAVITR